jgi:signal transduction histidine kinase
MRSLYVGIFLAMVAILALSLMIFVGISRQLERTMFFPVFDAMDELQLEDAQKALHQAGPAAVSTYMQRLNQLFGGNHYLLDSAGVDVASGKNRSELIPASRVEGRERRAGETIISHRTRDGAFWFIAVSPTRPHAETFYPYYLLVIAATGLLCWVAAVWLVSPIRNLTATVERFGRGELSARLTTTRRDELGYLARAFNETADRLQRLLTSERRLLADISHEMRSPLARLKFAVRLARTSPDQSFALDRIERDVDRIASMVSELVEITRAEGDPEARKFEMVDLEQVVNEIVSDERLEAELRGCRFHVHGRLPRPLWGDRELFRRAIENVVRNAVRYSPQHSAVEITLMESTHSAVVKIRDHGVGVPDELLTQIFKPFFRVEEARDGESGGVGLGLSIARRAIQLHQGTIAAENANPGLEVQITLPRLNSSQIRTETIRDHSVSG